MQSEPKLEPVDLTKLLPDVIDTVTDKPLYSFKRIVPARKGWRKWAEQKNFIKPVSRTYTLHRLTGGNAYRVTKKILEIPEAAVIRESESVLRNMYELFLNHMDKVAYIVAIGMTNSREEPSPELIEELLWEIPEQELRVLATKMVEGFDIHDFTSTIVALVGMDIIRTSEMTSPTVPGVLSEELSSTSASPMTT